MVFYIQKLNVMTKSDENLEKKIQANVVELYISYLRKKIDAGREPMIHTRRGAGYVLKPAGA